MSAPETPESVAQALARGDAQALQILAASADKRTAKAAKRALHLLRSRGVTIPEVAAAPRATAAFVAPQEPREPVWASTYDASGDRAIFLPLKATIGFALHLLVISEEAGIVRLDSNELSRKQVRATITDLSSEVRATLRAISPARAAAMIAEALALAPDVPKAGTARELLLALPEPAAPKPTPALASGESALRESLQLFETAPFHLYLPPLDVLKRISQQMEEVLVSPLLVDDQQRLGQLRHTLDRAIGEFFTVERRGRHAARMDDAAELFDWTGQASSAAQARAVAAALRSDRPIHEIPFARGLFDSVFDLQQQLESMSAEKAPPEAGLGALPDRLILPP